MKILQNTTKGLVKVMGLIRLEQIAGMNCHYYNYSLDYFFQSMEECGYKTVALWGGAPHFYLDYKSYSDCKVIREKASEHGLSIKCFTPSSGTYGYQMCMQPKSQGERCFNYYVSGIHAATELGCNMVSMNSGWGYWNEPFEEACKRSVDMIYRICKVAEREGVILTMESLRKAESLLAYNIPNTEKIYSMVNHPNLKIMIDTTAMAVAGETFDEWFEAFGADIVNTHFIDNNPYGHLTWGDGTADLEGYLNSLKNNNYEGILGLEITARRYYMDPKAADRQNMEQLKSYV